MPSPAEPPITWAATARTVAATVTVFAVAGVLAGWVWAGLTDPPTYEVVSELPEPLPPGAIVTVDFASDVGFLAVAAVGGLVCSIGCAALFRSRGLVLLASVLLGAAGASYLTYRTGTALGPPPLAEQAAGAVVGDVLTFPMQVGASAVLLVWPIAAVIGLMLTVSLLTPVPAPDSASLDPDLG